MTIPDSPLVNPLDAVAGIAVLFAAWRGYRRGLSAELWPMLSVTGAVVSAFWFARHGGDWLLSHTRLLPETAVALAFSSGAAFGFAVVIIAALLIRLVVSVHFNEVIEKPVGFAAGAAGGLLAVFLIFGAVILWPHEYLRRHFGERSLIGRGTTLILRWRGFDVGDSASNREREEEEPVRSSPVEL